MKGILLVDLPQSCKDCGYFNTILEKPLVINFSDGTTEVVSGACTCNIIDGHRLKPMDNGNIMEQITYASHQMGVPPHTESLIHTGRPNWCPIIERSVVPNEQNVSQVGSSQGILTANQREERSY